MRNVSYALRKNTHLEHSGRLLYDYSHSQRHKSRHREIPKIVPAVRQALHQTKLCVKRTKMPCDGAEARRASGFPQSIPGVVAKATDALISTLA